MKCYILVTMNCFIVTEVHPLGGLRTCSRPFRAPPTFVQLAVCPLQEDDEVPLGAPEYDAAPENGLLSRNEPIRAKVSKLTEKLRKRYPTASTGRERGSSSSRSLALPVESTEVHRLFVSTGNCSNCSTVFSVLKKRVSVTS